MKKIIGIFIIMLLIGTAIQTIGLMNEPKTIDIDYSNKEFLHGEFIVKFKESPISCVSLDNLNDKFDVKSMEKIFINSENTILDNIYIVKVSEDADILSIIKEYNSLYNVEYAEPNIIGDLCVIPNDEYFQYQWSLHNTGQNIFPPDYPPVYGSPDADIDALEAWDIENGSQEIIIALIDSGIDYTHPELADRIWVNDDEIPDNDIDDDNNGYIDDIIGWDFPYNDSDPLDLNGHGTFCGGVFGALSNNNIGIAGINWYSKVMVINIAYSDGANYIVDWVKGIKYAADNGADIMSMQILTYTYSTLLSNTINYAYNKGVFMCASAGNNNISDKGYPAALDKVLAVAATNENDERCDEDDSSWRPGGGSNYGYWIDVTAPGNWIATISPTYPFHYYPDQPMNYTAIGGTSVSCPIVAGVASLLLSQDPTLTNKELRKIIRANVDPYISDEYIGTGRINAYKALTRFNSQPEIPENPTGEISGRTGRRYTFTTSATDPDDEPLYYVWDWGDGNYSEETGPFNSGETCEATYAWSNDGDYSVIVKAVDGKGGESYWSESLVVSMPKNKSLNEFNPWLFKLIQRFPILELLF